MTYEIQLGEPQSDFRDIYMTGTRGSQHQDSDTENQCG